MEEALHSGLAPTCAVSVEHGCIPLLIINLSAAQHSAVGHAICRSCQTRHHQVVVPPLVHCCDDTHVQLCRLLDRLVWSSVWLCQFAHTHTTVQVRCTPFADMQALLTPCLDHRCFKRAWVLHVLCC